MALEYHFEIIWKYVIQLTENILGIRNISLISVVLFVFYITLHNSSGIVPSSVSIIAICASPLLSAFLPRHIIDSLPECVTSRSRYEWNE